MQVSFLPGTDGCRVSPQRPACLHAGLDGKHRRWEHRVAQLWDSQPRRSELRQQEPRKPQHWQQQQGEC
ncbi:hypothetical protein F751_3026 [Auxenochlorella protothecoides]|uniref:Uncharacterized protein n=1 Tax=Auxenochlorella protothecoides TaxID=3075 RepID=A0A087SF04_AUXPR|nr:hypothetical protein F751_3026 [Auxenochlorella protothecoides]KFM24308.1 hypothetical protein F751_3026 [Auxenochlorella protothecoides]